LDDEIALAKAVAAEALSTPGIHSLGTGQYAEAATYGLGEKVLGVVVRPEEVEVHVVVRYPLVREAGSVMGLADMVRERTAPWVGGRRVRVIVEDVFEEPEDVAV
jgi:hypothetical protein